jgi:hypothetical protein
LICSASILKPKEHSGVAVGAEWHDEQRLDLIFFLQGDLVITRVAI